MKTPDVRTVLRVFASLGLWAGACGPAAAELVRSDDPASIVTALQDAGYKAKLSKGTDGDPMIESGSAGNGLIIFFAECKENKSCRQVEFLSYWNCENETTKCNNLNIKWNSQENLSHTMVSGKNLALYYHMVMDEGVSKAAFIRSFEMFAQDAAAVEGLF